ncbi:MAG: 16S rRNA (adenine(1518)-N(6)/adenine(1519)-N(6))-dimethyltransferase RsmA, partial [Fusobacteriaceae bacterium]
MSDFRHKKKFGQNFLTNQKDILDKIIKASCVSSEDIIIEIGPGEGALTNLLLERAKKVFCFEIDADLEKILLEKFGQNPKFTLIMGDILEVDLEKLFDEENIKEKSIKVVANIPYYITSPIINKLINSRGKIREIFVMVQKEVAERICSKSGKERSVLTLAVEFFGVAEYLFTIQKDFFTPVPKVDSAFISIKLSNNFEHEINEELFFKYVKLAFANKRKNILNNLMALGYPKDELKIKINSLSISENERAENISISKFIELA